MPYTALPDRRIPYDNDGTVMMYNQTGAWVNGPVSVANNANMAEWNDEDKVAVIGYSAGPQTFWWFFPETRVISAYMGLWIRALNQEGPLTGPTITGSTDSTNGVDGTWETASLPSGPSVWVNVHSWRDGIKPVSFASNKRVLVINAVGSAGNQDICGVMFHWYGEKAAGQTPNDIIFIDHDTTPGVEYSAPEDFGDRPLGTTVTRQFRIKNVSPSLTANTIQLSCNDSEFAISTDGTIWVTTINIASLASGAESSTMYIRCTTPAVGGAIGPRFSRITCTVGSYA
jgi:hypothetical protein